VQVGRPVAKAGLTVHERGGRVLGHAAVAVGAAVDNGLGQSGTQRMPGTRSSAATKCISEVPGWQSGSTA